MPAPRQAGREGIAALAVSGPVRIHGSAAAVGTAGLLIVGPSGSGKSSLLLELHSRGAAIVSDDSVIVSDGPRLAAPSEWPAKVELRGLGLIPIGPAGPVLCRAVLDLGAPPESARMPQRRDVVVMGRHCPLLHESRSPAWVSGLMAYLRAMDEGRDI